MVNLQPRSAIFEANRPRHFPPPYQSPPPQPGLTNRVSPLAFARPQPRLTYNQPRLTRPTMLRPNYPSTRPPLPRMALPSNYLMYTSPNDLGFRQKVHPPSPIPPKKPFSSKPIIYSAKPSKVQPKSNLALVPVENVQTAAAKYENIKANIKNLEKNAVVQKKKQVSQIKRQIKKHPYIVGTVLALVSLVLFFNQNNFIRFGIDRICQLHRHGYFTEYGLFLEYAWANPPVYGRACFNLFGIKNGDEFLKGAKPHLYSVGPLCILATRRRRVLEWKKKTIKFEEGYLIEADEANSMPMHTPIKTINIPIFGAVYTVKGIMDTFYLRFLGPIVYNAIVKALRWTGEEMITEITPYQLMYRYELKILNYLDSFLLTPMRTIGLPIPETLGWRGFILPNMTFGMTTTVPGGRIGPFEMYHTTEDGHLVGDVYSALGFKTFPLKEPPCNVMKGGEGYFWRRPIVDDKITIFLFYLCRLLVIKKEFSHYFFGSYVTRYRIDEDMFRYSDNPENACHCLKENLRDCDGFIALGPCVFMVPIGITMAHFYNSPKQLAKVEGLSPNEDEHAIFIEMETELGIPIYGQGSLQVIFDIEPISYVPELANIPKLQLPIGWGKIKIGAIGLLGAISFIIVSIIHYGNVLWLLIGLSGSAFLFYKAKSWRNTP